jgi:excinuclease ABC subunit C
MKQRPREGPGQANLFPAETFDGFGPSLYRPLDDTIISHQVTGGKRAGRLCSGVREHAPKAPGVYGMVDEKGRIVYVGKAKNLRSRLLSYFRVNSRNPKAGKIIQRTRKLVWEQTGDELAALLRELELIQSLRPRFNILGLPGLQRHHYICIGRPPAPSVYISNKPTGKELAIYGPLLKRDKSNDVVRRLNDWFKLRDCPQTVPIVFSDQPVLFPEERAAKCLRFELQTCCGPCVGACSRKGYSGGVRSVKAFLDGRDRTILKKLTGLMADASEKFEYEKASAMRDRLEALQWIDARLTLLRQTRHKNSFVYPLTGVDGRERWYLIHRGQVRAVCFAPDTELAFRRTSGLLAATFIDRPESVVLADGVVDSVLLVAAWFRKHQEERARLMTKSAALELCATPTRPSFDGMPAPVPQFF